MDFRKILVILAVCFLFFGCINLDGDDNTTPNGNNNGTVNNGNNGGITINNGGDDDGSDNGGTVDNGDGGSDNGGTVDNGGTIYDPTKDLSVYFIDVKTGEKQGESILIKKGKYEILIDGGPAESGQTVVNFLDGRVEGKIEILVLSHDDTEHWGGIEDVLDNFEIGQVWWSGDTYTDEYNALIDKFEAKGILFVEIKAEDVFDVNGAEAFILNPPAQKFGKTNTDSVSMKLSYGNFCILLLSDTVQGSQSKIINEYGNEIECQVMQVPYHGLGAGNTQLNLFLKKIKPEVGIMTGNDEISTSESSDRAPTYQQLEWEDVEIYTTFPSEYNVNTGGSTVKVTASVEDGKTTYSVYYVE